MREHDVIASFFRMRYTMQVSATICGSQRKSPSSALRAVFGFILPPSEAREDLNKTKHRAGAGHPTSKAEPCVRGVARRAREHLVFLERSE